MIYLITTQLPFGRKGGDTNRVELIIRNLKKFGDITIFYLATKSVTKEQLTLLHDQRIGLKIFPVTRLMRMLNVLRALCRFEPLQFNLFYSQKLHRHLKNLTIENDDRIFACLIRSVKVIPLEYKAITMVDFCDSMALGTLVGDLL